MLSVFFNSHASLLVSDGRTAIYTDPFFDRAFKSWSPSPCPSLSRQNVMAILRKHADFAVAISHSHDDHCDVSFIKQFPQLTYIIPNYDSRSLERKLRRLGVESIKTLDPGRQLKFGTINLRCFFYPEISREDASITIADSETLVVHANDCWWPVPDDLEEIIRTFPGEVVFASQINTADGFPLAYSCYSDVEAAELRENRIRRHVESFEQNLALRKDMVGFVYAGNVKIDSPISRVSTQSIPDRSTVIKYATNPHRVALQVLDVSPGNALIGGKVGNDLYAELKRGIDNTSIRFESTLYHQEHKSQSREKIEAEQLSNLIESVGQYFNSFKRYVDSNSRKSEFRKPNGEFRLIARSGTEQLYSNCGESDELIPVDLIIDLDEDRWSQLINGEVVFDDLYIGALGWFSKEPRDLHNGDCVRWLSSFGYVWPSILNRPLDG